MAFSSLIQIYPSYFALHVRWPLSLTPVTDRCQLPGIHSIAAFLQHELFNLYKLSE